MIISTPQNRPTDKRTNKNIAISVNNPFESIAGLFQAYAIENLKVFEILRKKRIFFQITLESAIAYTLLRDILRARRRSQKTFFSENEQNLEVFSNRSSNRTYMIREVR